MLVRAQRLASWTAHGALALEDMRDALLLRSLDSKHPQAAAADLKRYFLIVWMSTGAVFKRSKPLNVHAWRCVDGFVAGE